MDAVGRFRDRQSRSKQIRFETLLEIKIGVGMSEWQKSVFLEIVNRQTYRPADRNIRYYYRVAWWCDGYGTGVATQEVESSTFARSAAR